MTNRQSGTLIEMFRTLLEEERREFIAYAHKRFEDRDQ